MDLLSPPLYIVFSLPCTLLHSRLVLYMPHLVSYFLAAQVCLFTYVPILLCSLGTEAAELVWNNTALSLRTRTLCCSPGTRLTPVMWLFILWASRWYRWNTGLVVFMTQWNWLYLSSCTWGGGYLKSVLMFGWTQWDLKSTTLMWQLPSISVSAAGWPQCLGLGHWQIVGLFSNFI